MGRPSTLNSRALGLPRPLDEYALLTIDQAGGLARLFKVFASETRLRLLHALVRGGEMCVTDLAEAVDMRPKAVSNQLQRLADRGILGSRREGNRVYYRVEDRCVRILLDRGLCLIDCHPEER